MVELFTDVTLITERLVGHQQAIVRLCTDLDGRLAALAPSTIHDPEVLSVAAERRKTLEFLRLDIKALYQASFAVYDAFRCFKLGLQLAELERIAVFRSKLVVHRVSNKQYASPPPNALATSWSRNLEDVGILGYPVLGGSTLLHGKRQLLRELQRYIPELASERNCFDQIDLVYHHWNDILDRTLRKRAREELFGATGLRSDPPSLVAEALLTILRAYRRKSLP
jgi:hypothetical protein